MRVHRWRIIVALAFLSLLTLEAAPTPTRLAAASSARLNAESVYALLDVIDAIAEATPHYGDTLAALASVGADKRRHRLETLAAQNAADRRIQDRIDTFLHTATRETYFRRFHNVTPDDFRRVFDGLPYAAIPAPGSIGTPYLDLVETRGQVRDLVDRLVAEVDLDACRDVAARWLPAGTYTTPDVYLVYDGNAGSYTAEGKAFYNLYNGEGTRDLNPGMWTGVVAHELHHVFAAPYLALSRRHHDRWEYDSMDMVVREMVSEGTAIHCNPPTGFRKDLWEDRETVVALVRELNAGLLALDNGTLTEDGFRDWYSSTFGEKARVILEGYMRRDVDDDRLVEAVDPHMPERPDLVHALGWWMVSRLSADGADPQPVQALIRNPYALLSLYNEVIPDDEPEFRVDERIIRRVSGE